MCKDLYKELIIRLLERIDNDDLMIKTFVFIKTQLEV